MINEIPNLSLLLNDIPSAESSISKIIEFAHTYNGYKESGSREECARIANERRHDSLADLRTCLFFEARRLRHLGEDPDEKTIAYLRGIIEKIRSLVSIENISVEPGDTN